MNPLYSELQWLPRAPEEFSGKAEGLGQFARVPGQRNAGAGVARSGPEPVDETGQGHRQGALRRQVASIRLAPFRLAVLSNSTIDLIVPALVASAARHGIALEVIQPSYDQVAQEALTPDSKVNSLEAGCGAFCARLSRAAVEAFPGGRRGCVRHGTGSYRLLAGASQWHQGQLECGLHLSDFAPPVETLFGSLDRALPGTLRSLIDAINRELAEFVLGSGDVLLDVAGLAETVGLADWHDPQLWNMAKFSFSDELIPLYADHVARTVAAIRGKSGKVLILDLDNTVWGGVIGDDGLEGIQDRAGRRPGRGAPGGAAAGAGSAATRNRAGRLARRTPTRWRASLLKSIPRCC